MGNKRRLRELQIDLEEVKAYRDLQSKPFDFGSGLITNDSNVSEDAYYEMEQQNIEDMIIELKEEQYLHNNKNLRLNKYARKRKAKKRLEKLAKQGVYFVYETEDEGNGKKYVKRFYLSGVRKLAKRETNKRIRKSKNDFSLRGGGYRKKYDYWWTVF